MAEVQAVKDLDTVRLISHLLERRYSKQMRFVWEIGINLALRVSDLLSIKFTDFADGRLIIKEGKTGKRAEIKVNPKTQMLINDIQLQHPHHVYLFQSYRNQRSINGPVRPLTRRSVSKAFELVSEELNIHINSHSMRKTRGYHLYKKTNDIARVMIMLRHSSESTTLRYIGITQEDVDRDFTELEL
jgi:integrase